MNIDQFSPTTTAAGLNACSVAVGITATTLTLAPIIGQSGANVRFVNEGNNWISLSLVSGVAATTSHMRMLPNSVEWFSLSAGVTTVSAICATTGNTLSASIGQGS